MIKKTLLLLTLLMSVVTGVLADTGSVKLNPTSYSGSSNASDISNAYATSTSTTYATITCEQATKSGRTTTPTTGYIYYTFTVPSLPEGATITSVTCTVGAYRSGNSQNFTTTTQLYNGTTAMGSSTSISSTTSGSTTSMSSTGSWTTDNIGNIVLRFNATNNSTNNAYSLYIGGADLTINYSYTPSKTLSSLAITGTPNTTYEEGATFDPTGLTVTGTYDDTSTADLTSSVSWTFSPETLSAGTTSCTATAKYGTVSATYTTDVTVHASNKKVVYAKESSTYPYRIPALAQNHDGKIIAIADNRPSGVDIGNGEVDLMARIDNNGSGSTWGTANIFADGSGGTASTAYGYGDAAVVADRESNKVLVMSCYATTGQTYYSGNIQTVRLLSTDGGSNFSVTNTWTASDKNTLLGTSSLGSFYTSGRILQSQYTKVGSYYRIYSALCVQDAASSYTSNTWVAYSDDFGSTWYILGGGVAVTGGNEAKLEELPDGRIVVSSRKANGRYFNIFTYTNTANAVGSWGTQSTNSTIAASDGTGTNGEILIVPAKDASNNEVYVALQSAPAGGTEGNRSHVSVYYKVLDAYANFKDVSTFATGWTLSKELSSTTSAYSTMILQQDGNIGLLYEENSYSGGYDIVYNKFALSELASGYTLNTSIDRKTFVTNYFTAYEETQTSWGSDVKAEYEELVGALADGITTAELDAIYSFIANPSVNYDGKIVTLACTGYTSSTTSTFTEYLYANSTTLTATETAPTDKTIKTYEFIMQAGENGGYTFQSLSNPTLYLGINTSDNMCLSESATEFTLTKNANYSTGYTSDDMNGYALSYKRVNTTTVGTGILVAVSNAQGIDKLNYTVKNWTSNNSTYYSTDFTINVKGLYLDATIDYGITDKTSFDAGEKDIVVFKRSFTKGQWTTLALPFSVNLTQLNNTFTNASVCELASITRMDIEGGKIYYRTQDHLEANVPVLAYITPNANDIYVFEGVKVENPTDDQLKYSETPDVQLVPVYEKTNYNEYDDIQYNLWFLYGGKFYDWTYLSDMNPFQAYIYNTTARPTTVNAKSFTFVPEGDVETSISGAVISMPESSTNNAIYNIAGQRVNSNAKGLLIKNGKKIFVK